MKKITSVVFGLLIARFPVNAQTKADAEQKAVKQTLVNLYHGEANADLKAIRSNCTPDFLMLQDSTVWDIDLLAIKLLTQASGSVTKNTLDFIKVNLKGTYAWVSYHNTAFIIGQDGQRSNISWKESAVLIKSKNHWLVSEVYARTSSKS
jgi:ketosteroid isomerase-like protein